MRFPNAPKMLPRSPMAAGTSTSSPGTRAKVAVIDAEHAAGHEARRAVQAQGREALPGVGPEGAAQALDDRSDA